MRTGGKDNDRFLQVPWKVLIEAYLADRQDGGNDLARALGTFVQQQSRAYMGADTQDLDDLIADTVIAILSHLDRAGEFRGNFELFVATVARNHCRNLILRRRLLTFVSLEKVAAGLVHPDFSPLDLVTEKERHEMLQDALRSLSPECSNLLRGIYIDDIPVAVMSRRMGLSSLPTAYYKRAQCLKKAYEFLKNRLDDCSGGAGHQSVGDSPGEIDRHE